MSIDIPYNRVTSKFEYLFFPPALDGVIDESTLRSSVDRINAAAGNIGKGLRSCIIISFFLYLAMFIGGWVMFGVGLGVSNTALLIAGIVVVAMSTGLVMCTNMILGLYLSNSIQTAVNAENKRFKESNVPIAFNLEEHTDYHHHYGSHRSSTQSDTTRKLVIVSTNQAGKPIDQPVNQAAFQPAGQPASKTMVDISPVNEHSIEIADHSMTRA